MGTQTQNPGSQTQQPNRPAGGQDEQRDRENDPRRTAKGKDAGNVPRSDDDVADEENQGTREDAAGGKPGDDRS